MSRRIRRTPFTARVEALGVQGFTVVNHMLLPKAFQHSIEDDYWHLREHVQIWDVSCQRQIEIHGIEAARLVQWMTPRNISKAKVGDCLYVPLVDNNGGMINDPIILKLAEDRYRLSIADSDVLLWAKGLALGSAMDVSVEELDVSSLAIQGPQSENLVAMAFGEEYRKISHFKFDMCKFSDRTHLISRTGYSSQDGFEIYVEGSDIGPTMWDRLWEVGRPFNIRAGCPNLIDRVEAGLLSYGNEMTRKENPLECGLEAYCDLSASTSCIGMNALRSIALTGISRRIMGLQFDGDKCPVCAEPWPVTSPHGRNKVGMVTSAVWSPRLKVNIALAMIDQNYWNAGEPLLVQSAEGKKREAIVCDLPFT